MLYVSFIHSLFIGEGKGTHSSVLAWKILLTEEPAAAAAAAKSLQSCPTLCDPIDGSPPGSSVHGILQARTLEWGALAFSGQRSLAGYDPKGCKESDATELSVLPATTARGR